MAGGSRLRSASATEQTTASDVETDESSESEDSELGGVLAGRFLDDDDSADGNSDAEEGGDGQNDDAGTNPDPNADPEDSQSGQVRYNAKGERLYTRGAAEGTVFRHSKQWRKENFFGPTKEDRETILNACRRWSREVTYPTRKPRYGTIGGMEFPPAYEVALRDTEASWKWYVSDGGQRAFQQRQIVRQITRKEASDFSAFERAAARTCILGPVNEPQIMRLSAGESTTLAEAFQKSDSPRDSTFKSGILLNLGGRIQSLDWAPNCPDRIQYLAVSTLLERDAKNPSSEQRGAPAFVPEPQHRSSIRIYRFAATATNLVDTDITPSLAVELCVAIGDIRTLKWCPVPSQLPGKLGLLACVSMDGAVRVLDVNAPQDDTQTLHLSIETFAFASKPPDTICTCLTWLDSNRIAAGCADGSVAVWDLAQCIRSGKETPRPAIFAAISTTYILAVVSCWPSYPDVIATSSMSGHITLTDLTKPYPGRPDNTVIAIRARVGQPILLWNDHTQAAFSVDDGFLVRGYLFRRFFTTFGVGRNRAVAVCMAGSPCHPFLLCGNANGEVVGFNPIVRIAHGSKAPLFQQIWFKHEWRRPSNRDQCLASKSPNDNMATAAKDGLARITEGYRLENILLNSDGKFGPNVKDGTLFSTIFEEETAVTALAWNPNLHVGGWAAAGMGNGLLRVEDLAS